LFSPSEAFRSVLQAALDSSRSSAAPSTSLTVHDSVFDCFSTLRSVLTQLKLSSKNAVGPTVDIKPSEPTASAASKTSLKSSAPLAVLPLLDSSSGETGWPDDDWPSSDEFTSPTKTPLESTDCSPRKSFDPVRSKKASRSFLRSRQLVDSIFSSLKQLFRDLKKRD
jgi:hypothetical protein